MADPRFFKKAGSFSLQEITDLSGCEISPSDSGGFIVDDVAPLHTANECSLSFLDNIKYKDDFKQTKAGACFVSPEMVEFAPENVVCLITKSPYKAYALAAQKFYPKSNPLQKIESSAVVPDSSSIGKSTYIGHHVVIGEDVHIGEGCVIGAGTSIGDGVIVGDNCTFDGQCSVSHAIVGDDVRLYPGVRVGQDGFGFAIDPAGHVKVPQLGRVKIGDHVEIGANTTIDRGAGPDTVIGDGTWIDNLVQIGHNVNIGRGCVIVSQVGISGSTQIGDFVAIGGQAGIAGHLTVGSGARIGAQSGVMNDIPPASEYMGSPAFPKTQFFRQVAALNRLIKKKKKD